jgi:hypothetical protein
MANIIVISAQPTVGDKIKALGKPTLYFRKEISFRLHSNFGMHMRHIHPKPHSFKLVILGLE